MYKKSLAVLLFSCFASLSVNAATTESAKAVDPVEQVQHVEGQINLNTADAATLEAGLVGIGSTKAQAIVDHRNSNGPFASVDELLEVKGIGPATLEKNRDRISVN
ncbi:MULTISPECIES: helix-hairpin-helix domain-containing protein [unclassified Pseudomonas]|uniref:ComEA family DNA-binding protein n=1 Tax=unclassified Pseudomonas TaxID=196821 RepID=UPI00244C605B|nr:MULTISPECIES: helix-hairpin-helix domain-containing protein [unclassified Pseudomonas]MDG9925354.1 helix-hairpin-helix domain-containing protein [Pseudomonas sp. GD04045]MDH0037306.1 helix-hairpin-helix domain-containing protein [Pseudomonas sp. GD04019]